MQSPIVAVIAESRVTKHRGPSRPCSLQLLQLLTSYISATVTLERTGGIPPTPIMADSFTLPLRPVVEQQDRPDTLPVEIAQINSQWGSFREVNEEVLLAKIAEEEARDGALSENGDQDTSDVDTTERLEQLYKRRAEITQFAMSVYRSPSIFS